MSRVYRDFRAMCMSLSKDYAFQCIIYSPFVKLFDVLNLLIQNRLILSFLYACIFYVCYVAENQNKSFMVNVTKYGKAVGILE